MSDHRPKWEGEERREQYENGAIAGLPWWVKAIALVGVPSGIALFLVWVGALQVPQIKELLVINQQEMKQTREMILQHIQQNDEAYRMLQRICSNTAKTEQETQRCFDR